jgi:hypothetical protein
MGMGRLCAAGGGGGRTTTSSSSTASAAAPAPVPATSAMPASVRHYTYATTVSVCSRLLVAARSFGAVHGAREMCGWFFGGVMIANLRVGRSIPWLVAVCRKARIFWLGWGWILRQLLVTEHHPAMEGRGLWSEELLCVREESGACMVRARCLCCRQGFVQPKHPVPCGSNRLSSHRPLSLRWRGSDQPVCY